MKLLKLMKLKKLIIGNWKLNPLTVKEAQMLASKIDPRPKHTAVICPPALLLSSVSYPRLGAQDCFWKSKGPYTGQVSPVTLKSLKVRYCIVGHSEKRGLGETDAEINGKIKVLLEQGIIPVLCVGFGTTVQQDELEVIDVLKTQLNESLRDIDASGVVVAYEPVWAISAGNSFGHPVATPEHAEKVSIFIKTKYHPSKVIYGGSANSTNAKALLQQPNIDGLLPGAASLLPDDFNKIINISV